MEFVVVRKYIDFLLMLISAPLVSVFGRAFLLFIHLKKEEKRIIMKN